MSFNKRALIVTEDYFVQAFSIKKSIESFIQQQMQILCGLTKITKLLLDIESTLTF